MGGGEDSRIPSYLARHYSEHEYQDENLQSVKVDVLVRTYSFDPEEAYASLKQWVSEFKPDLIIGESLGANHAMSLTGVPHLYVSPSMQAPWIMSRYAWASYIPGVVQFLNRFFRPTRPKRQEMDFRGSVVRKYAKVHQRARMNAGKDYCHAFFGEKDHYRKWGVVDVDKWGKEFGTYDMYPGTHYMEEEFLESLLIPKINQVLGIRTASCKIIH